VPKKGKLLLLDWRKVEALTSVRCCHSWVTDESIHIAQLEGKFDDPAIPWTNKTNRAARIGSIATMMQCGVQFNPLRIHVGPRGMVDFKDGNHRLRAYQFNNDLDSIAVWVTGRISYFKGCLSDNGSNERASECRSAKIIPGVSYSIGADASAIL
jgi:hypothetical protein